MVYTTTDDLCGHMKALLSGCVPENQLQPVIGRISRMSPDTRESMFDELSEIFTHAFAGDLPQLIKMRSRSSTAPAKTYHLPLEVRDGVCHTKHPFWDSILQMDFASACTQKLWAGLSRLNSYGFRETSTLSRSKKKKSLQTILHKPNVDSVIASDWQAFLDIIMPELTRGFPRIGDQEDDFLPYWAIPASKKKLFYINEEGGWDVLPRNDNDVFDVRGSFQNPQIQFLALLDPSEFLSRTVYGRHVWAYWTEDFPKVDSNIPISKLGIAPKNGDKPRIVVVMSTIMASLSYPLSRTLAKLNKTLSFEYVDAQDKAKLSIRQEMVNNHLREDKQIFRSFDQSAFTDNFPYVSIQRPVLERLRDLNIVSNYDLEVMDCISQGKVDMSVLRDGFVGVYGTGTTMGAFPSFALASLANGLVACFAYHRVYDKLPYPLIRDNKGPDDLWTNPGFWIVGDDASVRDLQVANELENIYARLGMVINPIKSITSDRTVEFCSTFITNEGIFKKKKIPDIHTGFEALKEPITYYGREAFLKAFPCYQQITDELLAIPKPYGLGPEIDRESSTLSPLERAIVAKEDLDLLANLQGDKMVARDSAFGFNRSGLYTQDAGGIPYPIKHEVFVTEDPRPSQSDTFQMLTHEVALLNEGLELISVFTDNDDWTSDVVQEAAGRVTEIRNILISKYKEEMERPRVIQSLAPEKKLRNLNQAPKLSETAKSVRRLRLALSKNKVENLDKEDPQYE